MTGLDRDRAFYPILVITIASYYVVFAVMGGSGQALIVESVVTTAFVLVAVIGFKVSLWRSISARPASSVAVAALESRSAP